VFGLGKLLTLPYSLPAAGIKYCLKQVIDMAEQEMTDDTAVKEELMLLNLRLEDGEIDEAEFKRQEAPLLVRYSEIRAYRKRIAEEQLAGLLTETADERVAVIETPPELDRPA
jgi:gas vesicle protein GvpG